MIGTVIGSYRLTEPLGDGGVGAVFRAVDAGTGREAAVRIFAAEVGRDPMLAERLRAMVPILKRLQHSNVGAVYDLITVGQQIGFFLEYVAGVTLDQARARTGRMAPNVAVSCAVQTLRGLEHAHEHGLFHHALRPTNVLVTPTGNIKVMDLGIGHALGANRKTREDRLLNVLAYLAPEQIQNQPGDTRADIYAVGVMLYELLAGKLPFEHRTEFALRQAHLSEPPASPRFLVPGLPDWVEQAVMRALAKSPAHRFANATEMRAVLEAGLGLSTSGHAAVVREAGGGSMGSAFSAAPPIPPTGQAGGEATVAMPAVVAPPMPGGGAPPPEPAGPLPVETPGPAPRRAPPPASDATVVLPTVSAAPPPAPRPSPPRPSPMEPTPALGIELPTLKPPTSPAPPAAPAKAAATPAPAPAAVPVVSEPTLAATAPADTPPAPDATLVGAPVTGTTAGKPEPAPAPAAKAPARADDKPAAKGAAEDRAVVPDKGKAADKGKAGDKAPAAKPAAGGGRQTGLLIVAAVLVVAVGAAAGFYWMQSRAATSAVDEQAAVTDPALTDAGAVPPADVPPPAATGEMPPADAVPPPVSTVPPATASAPPPAPAAVVTAPPKRTPKPKPVPAQTVPEPVSAPVVSAPPPAAPEPAPAAPKPAPRAEPDVVLPDTSYRKVKIVTQQGEGTREIDVNLMFLDDRIGVSPASGGATFRSVRYRDITSASYAREQRKRLFIKTSKHLLTIETAAEPLILRLDKDNFDAIIRQLETRSKKPVER